MSIESCKTISITKLKEWGYLNHGMKSGVISWSTAGEVHSKIGIKCTILEHRKFIALDYNQSGETIKYDVRIIYHNSKYFLHREAFNYLYYEKQIHSKKNRQLHSILDKVYLSDEVYEAQYKKHFKTHYNGKPTKRYQKILDKINTAETYPMRTIERLLMM